MKYKKINKCQFSRSKKIEKILSLGLIPPVNQMFKIGEEHKNHDYFPTEIYYCPISKLVQLGIIVDKSILFPKNYPYTSSTTKILRDNFTELAEEVFEKFKIEKNDLIIDIGSNDGNLLNNFKSKSRILGITPEDIGKLAIKKNIPTILKYFTENLSKNIKKEYGLAKIITATNVFAHMDNINIILQSIYNLLDNDGIFISESHYLDTLIEQNQYDTIYHEHLRYYSLSSLQYLFNQHNMEIISAKKISTHGGSIRVYASKKNQYKVEKQYIDLIQYEKVNLFSEKLYNFKFKVEKSKEQIKSLLKEINIKGLKIYGISAPSRATTLLNYLKIDRNIIDCILEIEGSQKINHYLPGTKIPIYNEKKIYEDQPEYALILSWHIAEEIINNLRKKGYKGRFIIPLPNPQIID
tara:strand:- start:33 stop:1262 length:1230 start_codon:yes stop_codon:yes gene_type:complete